MKLIRFGDPHKEKPGAILEDGVKRDLSSFGEDYDERFFESDGVGRLEKWLQNNVNELPHIDDHIRLGPPVCRPSKIVCIGFKSTSALSGPNDDVRLPRDSEKTDWEVELAVVIKKKTSYVEKETAMDHIAGYALFNDYSEREFQFNRGGQYVKGKSADTFAPLGPFLVTPDEITDYLNLKIWLKVNGIIKQDSNTSNMTFDVPTILAGVSQYMTLYPGDVVCTGTPAGVGHGKNPPHYLKPGDLLVYGIDGIGEASQRVIAWDS
jgi:2-keto-4-pentenoate hydratase/2-oxohepta-3-ene-1,7-dioic acid hydratase in catechol pathway